MELIEIATKPTIDPKMTEDAREADSMPIMQPPTSGVLIPVAYMLLKTEEILPKVTRNSPSMPNERVEPIPHFLKNLE